MERLAGYQRKFLRGLAHGRKPVVWIGQRGAGEETLAEIEHALCTHELIKVKFNAFKGREQKAELCSQIEASTGAELVGLVGHTAIFFRSHPQADLRRISVPVRAPTATASEAPGGKGSASA